MSGLELVALDADDTLWHNLIHFDAAQKRFAEMFANELDAAEAVTLLQAAERRNIGLYGFGVKGFTLSMIETALDVSGQSVDPTILRKLIALGRDMLDHDIEILPHVEETLSALHGSYRLLLVTKGDLLHQERKVLASGLAHFFEAVEIVSDKKPETYTRLCQRHGCPVGKSLMAGNSVRSDVLPMIAAGGFGVYVPFDILWEHEHERVPADTPRFFAVEHFGHLPEVVRGIG